MNRDRRHAAEWDGWRGSGRLAALFCVLACLLAACGPGGGRTLPLDEVMAGSMGVQRLPGAVIAARDAEGRTLLRAYGLADAATDRPVRPDTPFRLASLSKPITAAAVQRLIDQGALHLDDRLVDLLPLPPRRDPRVDRITLRHLLQHTAGWDWTRDVDPLIDAAARRRELGLGTPPDCGPIAFAMLSRPLQFDPGTAYAYSNLGYCFLELLVARRAGAPYADFVQRAVLSPLGIDGFRLGEAGLPADTLARPAGHGIAPPGAAEVALLGGAGGWVGTAADYLAIVAAAPLGVVAQRPDFPVPGYSYYGLGWRVWRRPGGTELSHFGALYGSFTVALRMQDGLCIVALFNARPGDDEAAFDALRAALPAAVRRELEAGAM